MAAINAILSAAKNQKVANTTGLGAKEVLLELQKGQINDRTTGEFDHASQER
jgi:hypothetical protein